MLTTPAASAQKADASSNHERSGTLPAWAQILTIIVVFVAIRLIPGLPYAGQVAVVGCVLAATWMMRKQGQTWADLGLRWAKTRGDLVKGAGMVVLVFAASVAVNGAVQAILPMLLGAPVERTLPDVSTLTLYLIMMGIVWTSNSFGEEMIMRGFLMSRFSDMFGGTRFAWVLAAFGQAAIFGAFHAYQGLAGIIITGFVGLVFGLLYLVARRNLWPLIIAHGLINTVGMTVLHMQATGAIPA